MRHRFTWWSREVPAALLALRGRAPVPLEQARRTAAREPDLKVCKASLGRNWTESRKIDPYRRSSTWPSREKELRCGVAASPMSPLPLEVAVAFQVAV